MPGDVPGYPGGDFLIETYARRTGRDLSELDWYLAFAFYKIAVIFEGIHYRSRRAPHGELSGPPEGGAGSGTRLSF